MGAQEAQPEVTLAPRDGQPLPLALTGDPDGATVTRADVTAPRLPPGLGLPLADGPPEILRSTILRL